MGLYWFAGHTGIRDNEITDELARVGSAMGFLGPEPALGVSWRVAQKKLGRWSTSTGQVGGTLATPKDRPEIHSREPVWVPGPNLSFNRTKSRVVTGLLDI